MSQPEKTNRPQKSIEELQDIAGDLLESLNSKKLTFTEVKVVANIIKDYVMAQDAEVYIRHKAAEEMREFALQQMMENAAARSSNDPKLVN